MIRTTPVFVESPRYATPVLFLPGLWSAAGALGDLPAAMAHRGWEGALVEVDGARAGGVDARATAIAAYAASLPHPPVLVGHDAGAIVALAVAHRTPVAALVFVSPVVPGAWPLRLLVRRLDAAVALLRGRPVPPPRAALLARVLGSPPREPGGAPPAEAAALVLDVVRGRSGLAPAGVPTLIVGGDRDPHLSPDRRAALVTALGAEARVVPGGHWLPLEPSWQELVATIHRWLVQQLEADDLELYAEAMAERGDDPD